MSNKPFTIGIIPARMGASRFPGKPMAKILGIPMIGHVYKRTAMSKSLDLVCVATCDKEIFDYINSIGGKAVMTLDTHERASDRCAECMLKIEAELNKKVDVVVMIQGDEPLVHPEMIDLALKPLIEKTASVVNLYANIDTEEDYNDPNEIKVVIDKNSDAVYFSRRPIPFFKKFDSNKLPYKQVCIIPFKREGLIRFNGLEQTELEKSESIDMLRLVENGEKVHMVYSPFQTVSVDNQEDLDEVNVLMKSDSLFKIYS